MSVKKITEFLQRAITECWEDQQGLDPQDPTYVDLCGRVTAYQAVFEAIHGFEYDPLDQEPLEIKEDESDEVDPEDEDEEGET